MHLLRPVMGACLLLAATAAAHAQSVPAKELFGAIVAPANLEARSIGSYAKGCLAGGVALPVDGEGYQVMRLSRNRNWGNPALIDFLTRFAAEMKREEGWPGLLVGDIAQPRGGPMPTGHKSHQIGLDADIWFKPAPAHAMTAEERENVEPLLVAEERGTEIVKKNWNPGFVALLRRAAVKPEVARIFVHPTIKRALCEAVPAADHAWLGKLRPIYGHNYHFHVRLRCPEGQAGCENQKDPPEGDGCGKEIDDWIKLVSKPVEPSLFPPVEEKTPDTRLSQLPAECRSVLLEGKPQAVIELMKGKSVPLPERRSASVR